ncbi:hypothetical protein AVEN_155043-1 [Araneus ventricosus]|uniref:Uncharacterized protein n=1 Tax=Araneus ventricosus TaxID=182803 RepID=A0A4Y2A931_ARAVE|nr:hypothetical protein AVEN_155043-1 [Araneus ventricosus]
MWKVNFSNELRKKIWCSLAAVLKQVCAAARLGIHRISGSGSMIDELEEGHSVTSAAQEFESTKMSFQDLGKPSKPHVPLSERLMAVGRGKQCQWKTNILSCR